MCYRALVEQLHISLGGQLEPNRPWTLLLTMHQNAKSHLLRSLHVVARGVEVQFHVTGDNLREHRMKIVSAGRVHLFNFFEVHPFQEF